MTTPKTLLDQHAQAIMEKLIESALSGDLGALRLCVERIMPRAKPDIGIDFDLPEGKIDSGDNMLHITNKLTQAVAKGDMTVDEAKKFSEFLNHQRWKLTEAEHKQQDEKWKKDRGW